MTTTSGKGRLEQADFRRLAEFVGKRLGIQLPDKKFVMVQARLRRRLDALGIGSYREYVDLVLDSRDVRGELAAFVGAITTNTTSFFRERHHFEYVLSDVVPAWYGERGRRGRMNFWSAACSTGEEPYTLAMVLSESERQLPDFRYQLFASDISQSVLEHARGGVYSSAAVTPIPPALRRRFVRPEPGGEDGQVRIDPDLAARIAFSSRNLLEPFRFAQPLDVVFCRNVLIYFGRDDRRDILRRFAEVMAPRAYLFLGHSETIQEAGLPFELVAQTTFRKT